MFVRNGMKVKNRNNKFIAFVTKSIPMMGVCCDNRFRFSCVCLIWGFAERLRV